MAVNNYQIIVPDRLIRERVDFSIAQMLPELSRNKIISVIKDKQATIKDKSFKAKDKIYGGEIIDFSWQEKITTNWVPNNIALDIVFEDDDIMVINKPAGLITHPGNNNPDNTLANALLYYNPELAKVDRVGIVHRLDKDTSGLLVVAKNHHAQQHIIKQLKSREVKREYNAIIYNHLISGGTIDEPLGRDLRNRIKQTIDENGKEAITHYRIIEKFADFTLVKVMLETGRTHQIRVHMASISYPLIGDGMYGKGLKFPKGADVELKNALKGFKRQALHAKRLSFIHPTSGLKVSFKSELPKDMQDFLTIITKFNKF